ncbi:hypothetical protein [Kibdelosporangium aridum]|uniref:DUF4367 domain-containing protein n=1 Tax=Kibdelosporangium aridum TaxID=2030 RepID=A0A1W2F0U3_KIBAR|nr:hypothetical protein [Kibdelosporangium aridum]SMD15452.1 hypothetical protein SAMN05661093_05275 [Kibdelosporangium aridum]
MDEREIIEGLRRLELAEPKLGFDPDEVAGRAAKRLRTRRAILATSAGTLVVAAMAVATLIYGNASSGLPLVPAVTTTSSPRTHPLATTVRSIMTRLVPDAKDVKIDVHEEYNIRLIVVGYRDGFSIEVRIPETAERGLNMYLSKFSTEPPQKKPDGGTLYLEKPTAERRGAAYYRPGRGLTIVHNEARSTLPLNEEQLIALVSDPSLVL